jgi:hypothetical protein
MTSDDCRKLAVEAERRGMWSEAAQLWREAIARHPDKSDTDAALRDIRHLQQRAKRAASMEEDRR